MKKDYQENLSKRVKKVPVRLVIAGAITFLEAFLYLSLIIFAHINVKYFSIAVFLVKALCLLSVLSSDDNPDYKVPWLVFIMFFPLIAVLFYQLFYSKKLSKKYLSRIKKIKNITYEKDDTDILESLKSQNEKAYLHAKTLLSLAKTHAFNNCECKYFQTGEESLTKLYSDLENAKKFIYLEYYIISGGKFLSDLFSVIKKKAHEGVEVKILFDDFGSLFTLPKKFIKTLKRCNIQAIPFSRIKYGLNRTINNRNHRKICIIDGIICYTGGINIADEYIGEVKRFGEWKDSAIRLKGECVYEYTKLFLVDFGVSNPKFIPNRNDYFPKLKTNRKGFYVPFGDAPYPICKRRVAKTLIENLISNAKKSIIITTPYLVLDNGLLCVIENAAIKGVDVKIILPGIPDKKWIKQVGKSFYFRLINAGVKIYEYKKGFVHAKTFLIDDEFALLGSINFDYRSLVHHFENGVFMYNTQTIKDVRRDMEKLLLDCERILKEEHIGISKKFVRAIIRVFSPLL